MAVSVTPDHLMVLGDIIDPAPQVVLTSALLCTFCLVLFLAEVMARPTSVDKGAWSLTLWGRVVPQATRVLGWCIFTPLENMAVYTQAARLWKNHNHDYFGQFWNHDY